MDVVRNKIFVYKFLLTILIGIYFYRNNIIFDVIESTIKAAILMVVKHVLGLCGLLFIFRLVFRSLAKNIRRDMMEEPNDPPSNTEPSVYLDQRILPQNNQQLQTEPKGQLYTVNDSTYRVEERRLSDGYLQFKVYAERVASPDLFADVMGQRYTCDEAETEDGRDRELKMTIQKVSHGIVINSNVFLTEDQWNTITYVDGYLVRCVACEMFTDTASCSAHVERDSHRSALERCRPLAKFDLSIVRKIRNQYHCGVCNETFDLKNESDHFASESHEEKKTIGHQ